MKKIKVTYTDVNTNDKYECECFPHEIHEIDRTNKDLSKWCEGRILLRIEDNKNSFTSEL